MTDQPIPHWLSKIAAALNLDLFIFVDAEDIAAECHHKIDLLIREHAVHHADDDLVKLLDLHDAVEAILEEVPLS